MSLLANLYYHPIQFIFQLKRDSGVAYKNTEKYTNTGGIPMELEMF